MIKGKVEAICFLLQVETHIYYWQTSRLSNIFPCASFQQGRLGIQCMVFLVQKLCENGNAHKYKLQTQKCFYHFQISGIMYLALTVLLFLSKRLFLEVDLIYATQLSLDQITFAWVILIYLDTEQWVSKKCSFSISLKCKNVFLCLYRSDEDICWPHTQDFQKEPTNKKILSWIRKSELGNHIEAVG